jgi:hypothetical protein
VLCFSRSLVLFWRQESKCSVASILHVYTRAVSGAPAWSGWRVLCDDAGELLNSMLLDVGVALHAGHAGSGYLG